MVVTLVAGVRAAKRSGQVNVSARSLLVSFSPHHDPAFTMPSPPLSGQPDDFAGPTLPRTGSGVRVASGDSLFKAGDRVGDNIELVSLLGVGGMGDVWLANHIGLGTPVAVKFMSAALAHDSALIERFAREAKLASRIKSAHVVQIFDYATTREGVPYIVMELIEGETLDARIRRDGKLGTEETSRILVQLSRALAKAHEIGIIHRDIKPENVLLGLEEGELFVKILDFGIAKHVDGPKGMTDAGAILGTSSYMSPEQLFHPTDVDHHSDLWALGVMTYQCLTGSLPFQGDSFGAVCLSVNAGAYAAASTLNPDIPRGLDGWFAKALAVSPEERFGGAKEMSDAYLQVLEGAEQLLPWAVRKDHFDGEGPAYSGGTGAAIPISLVPTRHVRGSRRRVAAIVIAGAMLVAVGFLSRDAALGRFVRAHVPAEWSARADGWRAATPMAPPPVELPSVGSTVATPATPPAPSVAVAVRPTVPKVVHVAPSATIQAVAVAAPSPPAALDDARSANPAGSAPLPPPALPESESNPYAETAPTTSAPQPAVTPRSTP